MPYSVTERQRVTGGKAPTHRQAWAGEGPAAGHSRAPQGRSPGAYISEPGLASQEFLSMNPMCIVSSTLPWGCDFAPLRAQLR